MDSAEIRGLAAQVKAAALRAAQYPWLPKFELDGQARQPGAMAGVLICHVPWIYSGHG